MKIDTNAPYKVPKEYEAKKVGEPKMKKSSVFMVILGTILIYAAMAAVVVAIVWGVVYGISKISESANNVPAESQSSSQEANEA